MSMSSNSWCVKIYYGPYFSNGLPKHQFHRVQGIFQELTKLNYDVEIIPTNLLNRLSIELCNKTIFTCDIRNLKFNMEYLDDPVCQRAVESVEEVKTASKENRIYKMITNASMHLDNDVSLLYEIVPKMKEEENKFEHLTTTTSEEEEEGAETVKEPPLDDQQFNDLKYDDSAYPILTVSSDIMHSNSKVSFYQPKDSLHSKL